MHCHKILIVEDDKEISSALIDLLSSEGYEAVPAYNGLEAIELLKDRKEDPCLILTDLMMPKMNGWDLIKTLYTKDVVITIPVVVMSASANSKMPDGKKVIKKPFNLDIVLSLVKEHCGNPNGGPITKDQTSL